MALHPVFLINSFIYLFIFYCDISKIQRWWSSVCEYAPPWIIALYWLTLAVSLPGNFTVSGSKRYLVWFVVFLKMPLKVLNPLKWKKKNRFVVCLALFLGLGDIMNNFVQLCVSPNLNPCLKWEYLTDFLEGWIHQQAFPKNPTRAVWFSPWFSHDSHCDRWTVDG